MRESRARCRLRPPAAGPAAPEGPWQLWLYGALGGLCVEFFRWRKLLMRPHGKAYVGAPFIILSAIFVILAGAVGFVFGRLVAPGALREASAFIFGAGLEEVVKRAARLRKPSIAFGKGATKTSLHEFLRG